MFSSSGRDTSSWVHTLPITRVNCPGMSPSGTGAAGASGSAAGWGAKASAAPGGAAAASGGAPVLAGGAGGGRKALMGVTMICCSSCSAVHRLPPSRMSFSSALRTLWRSRSFWMLRAILCRAPLVTFCDSRWCSVSVIISS